MVRQAYMYVAVKAEKKGKSDEEVYISGVELYSTARMSGRMSRGPS